MKPKAIEYFHKKPQNLNCAQSILKSWQKDFNIDEKDINSFIKFGGGRAPYGLCGAVYAADHLLALINKPSIQDNFENKLAYKTCSELKRKGRVSCENCVEMADELISQSISNKL